jgi:hypothetical protein
MAYRAIRATIMMLATASAVLACGGTAAAPGDAAPKRDDTKPKVVLLPEQLYVLEATGLLPEDTTITFLSGTPRTIVLRHGPPDNTVFLQLDFPAKAFPAPRDSLAPRDSVRMEIRPRPGIYAVDIRMNATPGKGATIRFKYPVHFAAPNAAIARYGTRGRYERALMIGVQLDSTEVGLLESERPGSDNLRSAFLGTGTYLVAAPR